jgi:Na+/phosphate symporter
MLISDSIATYVFSVTATLAGLITITDGNNQIRHFIVKSNILVDISIFILTIYSTITPRVTTTASLTFAGLGYSLVYAPWLRSRSN